MVTINMAFLSSLQTRQILFYLTVICNLATCSFNASSKVDDETNLVSGCRYTYPSYINPYTPLIKIDLISCRNMLIGELPFYENVTSMELVNVPLTVLNGTEIPNAVQSPRVDLRQLRWTKSHIKIVESIPTENLIELDLSWNLIKVVHANAFKKLVDLTLLNVSHNNLESLPDNLFAEHNSLKVLSLAYNQLKTMPRDISNYLVHLETLDLSNNHLKHLKDTTFHRHHRLIDLNLAHNRLSLLAPNTFKLLPALKYLSLEANQLSNIESGTFDQQHELMVLNLGKNPLLSLPGSLLPNNNTLFVLTISHTKLLRIELPVLKNLRQLRSLYLTDNHRLENLSNDTFVNANQLKVIHLQNNNFTQLPHSILDTELDSLLLDGNPWPCDCSTQWIALWAHGPRKAGDSDRRNGRSTRTDYSLRLTAYCNATGHDFVETLRKLLCKPTVLRVSPVRYESLEANVKLVCRSYANPAPTISWLTPTGVAYIESTTSSPGEGGYSEYLPPRLLHSAFANRRHLPTNAKDVDNNNNNLYLYENGDLYIKQMSRDDAGEYMCVVSNQMGESSAYTRLYVDPSIMQRIKTGSIISGFLWINTFLLFSVVYLLIRRYSRRAKQEKRKRRMNENMDIYKSQQISRLRDRCKNQMNRIKNNCSIQVEWMKDNYRQSMNNSQDHRASYLTNQYNEQMAEIRDYYITQMHTVREHFDQQRKLILEFSINRVGNNEETDTCSPPPANDVIVKMENGTASTLTAATDEDDVYRYNEIMKSEIQKLTSLRNLHEAFVAESESKFGAAVASTSGEVPAAANTLSRYDLYADNVSNGKLRTSEDEGDEKTSMLYKAKISH